MSKNTTEEIHQLVRNRYAPLAKSQQSCCVSTDSVFSATTELGYSKEDISGLEEIAQTSLGCGNPLGLESIRPGDTVLDLGSGTGLDCFLAARTTGESGNVIGVDMTPEMVEKAKNNALQLKIQNVEFRLGQIESLPVNNRSVDLVISNCVINLSPDKERVFREVFRVLRPNGRLVFTDIVTTAPIDPALREDTDALTACAGGAALVETVQHMLEQTGFTEIQCSIVDENWNQTTECCAEKPKLPVVSARIIAIKSDLADRDQG